MKNKSTIKIGINYPKGGVGKTTTTLNLGYALAELGYSVLLVDMDREAYLSAYFEKKDESKNSIFEVMNKLCTPEEAIVPINVAGSTDIVFDLLPANKRFDEMEDILSRMTRKQEYTLKKALESISNDKYDFILFDCPQSGIRVKVNILAMVDYTILTCTPDPTAVQGFDAAKKEITNSQEEDNPNMKVLGMVMCMHEAHLNLKKSFADVIYDQPYYHCFSTAIRKSVAIQEANAMALPVIKYKPSSPGAVDYRNLALEVLEEIQKDTTLN